MENVAPTPVVDSKPQDTSLSSIPDEKRGIQMLLVALICLLVVAVGVTSYLLWSQRIPMKVPGRPDVQVMPDGPNGNEAGIACTLEAKICPDGTSVGRSGPNCEFAECPTIKVSRIETQMNFSLELPQDFKILEESPTKIVIGTTDPTEIPYLTITRSNTVEFKTLNACSEANVFPCLSEGTMWGQSENNTQMTVGGKLAHSFYILTGTVDSAEHVVQVEDAFEARMNVAGGGLDQAFTTMLASIEFSN